MTAETVFPLSKPHPGARALTGLSLRLLPILLGEIAWLAASGPLSAVMGGALAAMLALAAAVNIPLLQWLATGIAAITPTGLVVRTRITHLVLPWDDINGLRTTTMGDETGLARVAGYLIGWPLRDRYVKATLRRPLRVRGWTTGTRILGIPNLQRTVVIPVTNPEAFLEAAAPHLQGPP